MDRLRFQVSIGTLALAVAFLALSLQMAKNRGGGTFLVVCLGSFYVVYYEMKTRHLRAGREWTDAAKASLHRRGFVLAIPIAVWVWIGIYSAFYYVG